MKLNDKFTISPHVATTAVADEMVLLDLPSGTYFGLGPVGARIWGLAVVGKGLDEICEVLFEEYDVDRVTLMADVTRLFEDLINRGLVSLV